jgi:hypothetical protein
MRDAMHAPFVVVGHFSGGESGGGHAQYNDVGFGITTWRVFFSGIEPVHPAYNPSFSACFFSQNNIFLSHQISQQCFSVGLSAQPNGAIICKYTWQDTHSRV